jgi:hypothetical protein
MPVQQNRDRDVLVVAPKLLSTIASKTAINLSTYPGMAAASDELAACT